VEVVLAFMQYLRELPSRHTLDQAHPQTLTELRQTYVVLRRRLQELLQAAEATRLSPPSSHGQESIDELSERRDELRRRCHERNLVLKQLIDRLHVLRQSLHMLQL